MLKTGCRGCGMSGVMGSAGAYYVGARTRPQLIGCALAQEPGVLNFGESFGAGLSLRLKLTVSDS